MTIGRFPKSKLSLPKPNVAKFRQIAKVQLAWIDQEYKEIKELKGEEQKQRAIKFTWAPEKHIQTLKMYLNGAIDSLKSIANNESIMLKEEVAYWAHVVLILMQSSEFNNSLKILEKHERIKLTFDIKSELMLYPFADDSLWLLYSSCGEDIQLYIVLSYLKGEINK